ncbi:hypothetical protein ACFVH0_26325 [Streptomyces sp. NPDC127117]|uniref:hypothetical protein n=1 Tax=Streptomyces sp. NPDC127117 TaxID=3345368 RepID=UPI003628DD43
MTADRPQHGHLAGHGGIASIASPRWCNAARSPSGAARRCCVSVNPEPGNEAPGTLLRDCTDEVDGVHAWPGQVIHAAILNDWDDVWNLPPEDEQHAIKVLFEPLDEIAAEREVAQGTQSLSDAEMI